MGVRLSDFSKRIILERKLIRKNKGPSIVPLMIIRFTGLSQDRDNYYEPHSRVMLLTVCQRTGSISGHSDLTKLYSGVSFVGYTHWWNMAEVVRIKPPSRMSTSRLLEIYIVLNENLHDTERQIGW